MSNHFDKIIEFFTFSQRHGYEPLPLPMRLGVISEDLRRQICNTIHGFLKDCYSTNYQAYDQLVKQVFGEFEKVTENSITTERVKVILDIEKIVLKDKFNHVLDFLEILLFYLKQSHNKNSFYLGRDHDRSIKTFVIDIERLFELNAAAYWLNTSQEPYQFIPRASKEQGEATKQAIETITQNKMSGAASHLRKASKHINVQQYADSIRESIHAVESVARKISPDSCNSLGPALNSLMKAKVLNHQTLVDAFKKLYGYTNDEEGIRHPLLEKETADVGLDEAMFMFGACASFAAYLSVKQKKTSNS